MRFIIALAFCISLIFAETINISETNQSAIPLPSQETNISLKPLFETVDTNISNDINLSNENLEENETTKVKKQDIFLSFIEKPAKIYVNQQFSIKIKAIVTTKDFDEIKTKIVPKDDIKVLNIDDNWTKTDEFSYQKKFYFRAKEDNATLPQIFFELYKDGNLSSSQEIPDLKLNILTLNKDRDFSNVLASWLDVLKVKTTHFDEENLMVVLEIVAKNANLKDFNLSYVTRGGIDSYVDNFPISRIYYYAIVPKYTDKLVFSYFNLKQNRFIKKSINLVLSDEDISTQSDLNPQNSSYNLYKNITYAIVSLILLLLFIKRRRIIYLLLFLVLIILFILGVNPLRSIKIAKNSKVYILPTKNSTLFYITKKRIRVKRLNKRENYIKIILPDGKIGWIKEKNVIKD